MLQGKDRHKGVIFAHHLSSGPRGRHGRYTTPDEAVRSGALPPVYSVRKWRSECVDVNPETLVSLLREEMVVVNAAQDLLEFVGCCECWFLAWREASRVSSDLLGRRRKAATLFQMANATLFTNFCFFKISAIDTTSAPESLKDLTYGSKRAISDPSGLSRGKICVERAPGGYFVEAGNVIGRCFKGHKD